MTDTPESTSPRKDPTDKPIVNPASQAALLTALDNTSIHYYRYLPKEKMLVLPESTARAWQCETEYTNVPEDKVFFAYLADEDKPGFVEMLNKIAGGEPTAVTNFKVAEFDRWCRVTMTTVAWDDDGSPLEAIAIIEDRSEEVKREELARERNEALSFMTQVFQIAALATDSTVVIFDMDTKTITAPETTALEWGVPAEHINGPYEVAQSDIIMPESKDAYLSVHEQIMNGASTAKEKVKLLSPTGEVETYELILRVLHDQNGEPMRKAVGVFNNISDFEEQSQHQEAMMNALAKGINAAFFVDLDNDAFVLEQVMSNYMSDTIQDFVDANAVSGGFEEITRLYCEQMVSEEDRDRMLEELTIDKILHKLGKTPSYFLQYRMVDNPEQQEYFEMHIVSTEHVPGNNAFISFRCIDDQKSRELQQQQAMKDAYLAAQQASKAKSEFFSRMSHDIRTPMNAIVGMTALAETHIDDTSRVLDCLSKIGISSRHLLGLINDVLDMSKIESGMVDLNAEDFDLAKLVENLISMSQHLIEEHGHSLLVNVHDIEHEKVVGDPQRIQQAFMNLMSNAVKYTLPGGTIRLSITEKPIVKKNTGCYEFVFEDNGIGMSPEFIEHIFEPFTRDENDLVDAQQGTGLGMSITNNVIQMMNGSINVESELGTGSKFTVTIYLELQNVDTAISPEQLEGLPVLVVDDDQVTCESTCNMLVGLGMRGEWVLSGDEAVAKVVEHHEKGDDFFVIFLDWKMPKMDGLATTQAIREAVGEHIPIIIASAYDWSEIEAPARGVGVNGFISKPLFKSRVLHQFRRIMTDDAEELRDVTSSIETLQQKDYAGKRLLLVEDNPLNREIAIEFFKMAGFEVDIAENGRQAVDMMETCEDDFYDIVFMDIQMPFMNGYDAARAIRSSKRNYLKSVPIVAMTADAFAEDVNAARSAGMNEHLAKPIDLEKLNAIINRWVKAN